ncbi:FecR family protein [Reyranella massiliensis]|uniref:FecR family protein n=1 Tax=Reyranella massiliensis TaxID=445220 RepID=UPI0003148F6B|nr:FecR domain-containing protein [Reyranella massiliensis]
MQEQPPDPLIEEALRWFVALKDRSASEADHAAFNRWLQEDPRHVAAWKQAQRTWMRVGKIGPAFANSAPAAISLGASAVAALPPPLAATPAMRPTVSRPAPVSRRRLFYAAAAVTAMVVPTALALSRPGLFADQRTTVGERQTISLPDGSTVELAGASALSVDFAGKARRVVLHAGEAFFDVVLDPERPFVVEAAAGSVRTPGAVFDVKFTDDAVTAAAVRGAVEVSATGLPPANVGEGQQVRYGERQIGPVHQADPEQVQAWRHDRLLFRDTSLGDAIADLERYRGGHIVVTDSRLRALPVTAAFDARQADAALDTMAQTLPIRVRRLTDFLVVLSPRA